MPLEQYSLEGRVAVVTGGSRGIGRVIAEALIDAGASVAVADIDAQGANNTAGELARNGARTLGLAMDVTASESVRDAAFAVKDAFGRIDIAVNNAGICRNTDAAETSDEDWLDVIDVNLNGVFRCCRAFGRVMLAQGSGAIVNIGSMSGIVVNRPQPQAAYNVSKAGVHMLTKSLAAEWAGSGVRVNAVAPGYIATEMTKRGMSNREWAEKWIDMTPMKRLGEPPEVASLVLYLASDAASYVTGSIVGVDGGYTAW